MIKEWFLIIIIFVQPYSGDIDKRTLYASKKDNLTVCQIEAKWTEESFESQLGNESLRRLLYGSASMYETPLGGLLVGFSIGCEERERIDYSTWKYFKSGVASDPIGAPFGGSTSQKPTKPKKKVRF